MAHLVLIGTLAAAGSQGAVPSPQPQPTERGIVPQGKDPYANVFRAREKYKGHQDPSGAAPSRPAADTQSRVVCGMVVIPVKPSADPKMVVQSKQDPKTDYRIRKIAPQICNE